MPNKRHSLYKMKGKYIMSRYFELVKDKEDYYVIDLTYRQFFKEIDERFKELDMDGYQKVDEAMLHSYINSICKDIKENDYESLFFRK